MESDNCPAFERDVEGVCDFRYRYDSVGSNTDKMISMNRRWLCAGSDSVADNETDAKETGDVVVTEYCCIVTLMRLMQVLKNIFFFDQKSTIEIRIQILYPADYKNQQVPVHFDYSQSSSVAFV